MPLTNLTGSDYAYEEVIGWSKEIAYGDGTFTTPKVVFSEDQGMRFKAEPLRVPADTNGSYPGIGQVYQLLNRYTATDQRILTVDALLNTTGTPTINYLDMALGRVGGMGRDKYRMKDSYCWGRTLPGTGDDFKYTGGQVISGRLGGDPDGLVKLTTNWIFQDRLPLATPLPPGAGNVDILAGQSFAATGSLKVVLGTSITDGVIIGEIETFNLDINNGFEERPPMYNGKIIAPMQGRFRHAVNFTWRKQGINFDDMFHAIGRQVPVTLNWSWESADWTLVFSAAVAVDNVYDEVSKQEDRFRQSPRFDIQGGITYTMTAKGS